MLNECKELHVGDKVVNDALLYQEMVVIQSPFRERDYDFVKCEWVDASGQIKSDTFIPEQLSFLIDFNLADPHLQLLALLLDDASRAGTSYISLHYHPNRE